MTNQTLVSNYPKLEKFFRSPVLYLEGASFFVVYDAEGDILGESFITLDPSGYLKATAERPNYYLCNKVTGKVEATSNTIIAIEMMFEQAEGFKNPPVAKTAGQTAALN
jgi:hypothetical protein